MDTTANPFAPGAGTRPPELHQFTAVSGAARRVSETAVGALPEVGRLGPQLVGDAALAIVTLLVTTTLSVYKPWGLTRHGRRERYRQSGLSLGRKILIAFAGLIVAAFIVLHLAGGGLHHGR